MQLYHKNTYLLILNYFFPNKNSLDIIQAQKAWTGVDVLLSEAMSELNKTANSQSKKLASFGLNQRQSGLPEKEKSIIGLHDIRGRFVT